MDGRNGRYEIEAIGPDGISVARQRLIIDLAMFEEFDDEMASPAELRDLGSALWRAIFQGDMGIAWERCRQKGDLILNIRPMELALLPWELLYDAAGGAFLVMRHECNLIRTLDIMSSVSGNLQFNDAEILHVGSSPIDYEQLEIKAEALGSWALVTSLRDATPARLRKALAKGRNRYEVFHFDGHAGFDEILDTGFIVLQNKDGYGEILTAEVLADYLASTSIKLVTLAACQTASEGRGRFAGLAQHLLRSCSNVLVVVAYRLPIEDKAATAFSEAFHEALALGRTVKDAVVDGRHAIRESSNSLGMALTVVLFMR